MAAHQAPPSLGFSRQDTGVGCHFLLQCMKVKSETEVAQSCPTFSDPMDCSLPGSSVHGIFQARVLEWGAITIVLLLLSRFSRVRLCVTPQTAAHQAPHPWDSSGKNTGVGYHFLLNAWKWKVKVKSLSRVRLLATPWTAAYQAPPSMGFSRQEYWSGVPFLTMEPHKW